MTPVYEIFSRVREIFNQEQIAEHLSYSIRTIRRWESDKNIPARKEAALAYAFIHNIPVQKTLEDGGFAELQFISEEGNPIYYRTFNSAAAESCHERSWTYCFIEKLSLNILKIRYHFIQKMSSFG